MDRRKFLTTGGTAAAVAATAGFGGQFLQNKRFSVNTASVKIGKPVATRVAQSGADHYSSDCPMAGHQIQSILGDGAREPEHPMSLVRRAYGI